ncbi:MAG: hypothetical protein NTU54_06140 [Candidatus Omnitrophica bacterium]|nr:hypothetical protein [Candidatus Omnitrophota bacterium]
MDSRARFSLIFIVLSLLAISAFSPVAFAANPTGPASYYLVRITKFELWNGTEWITAFSGTSDGLNIAAASDTSSSVGNFLSGIAVPDGTYTSSRVTPSGTFVFSGNDGAGNYTTANIGAGAGVHGSTPTTNAALEAQCTITVTAGAQEKALSPSIVVKDGTPNHRVRVKFNLSNAIENISGELFPAAPAVSVSVI